MANESRVKAKATMKADGRPVPLNEQVRGQLHALSQSLEETSRQYISRLQREIAQVSDSIPQPGSKKNGGRNQIKQLQQMSEILGSLQIKPNKGRRKDLKRIDELIGELENLIHGG